MKVTENFEEYWALSSKFPEERLFLGVFCWPVNANTTLSGDVLDVMGVALFETRKLARKAQKTCCYHKTRVEKVRVIVEAIK